MKLAIIGYGAIARQTLAAMRGAMATPLDALTCLARPEGVARAAALLDEFGPGLARETRVATSIGALLDAWPDLVVEAAGHEALAAHGAAVLAAGRHLVVTSVGALAREELRAGLDAAARAGRARYEICAGAIGGLDLVDAARLSGLTELVYTSRKPPSAWRGTAAEKVLDLNALSEATSFFEGTAREAVLTYPQNANVAATLALRGAGFEATRVRLIADPGATRNTHEIKLVSACVNAEFSIAGLPSPDNPKTSMTTGFALAAHVLRIVESRRAPG